MKKLFLTLIAILMAGTLFANNYVISNEEKEVDINKVAVPAKFSYFDDLGCSTYQKCYGKDPGSAFQLVITRACEYNHAYDKGIDDLRLNAEDLVNILDASNLIGPRIFGSEKRPGYITYYHRNEDDWYFNNGTIEYIKQKVFAGYGVRFWLDVHNDYFENNTYYCDNKDLYDNSMELIVVGWDDNYPKENFIKEPATDGAFLVQPSNSDRQGLYWLSYCNKRYNNALSVIRYSDKSEKKYTSYKRNIDTGKTLYPDYKMGTVKHKWVKVNFDCDTKGISYGFQYIAPYSYLNSFIHSYKLYLNDNLIEERQIDDSSIVVGENRDYFTNIDFDNPVSYDNGDVISVELTMTPYYSDYYYVYTIYSYDFSNEADRIAYGGKKETTFFRDNEDEEWWSLKKNLGTEVKPNYYYAQVPVSLLVDETVKSESLDFVEDEVNIDVYGKAKLKWQFTPNDTSNQNVYFESSDLSVVMVNDFGEIKGLKKGTATIKITSEDTGLTDTCKVIVSSAKTRVSGVSLDKNELNLKYGESYKLKATVSPSDAYNKKVIWSSSDSNIVAVDQNGNVSGFNEGEATVTVETVESGYTATCKVTVTKVHVTGITLDKYNAIVNEGKTVVINETVLPANASDKSVTWESSNTDVATVDETGVVTGVTPGTVSIKVISNDNPDVYATCSVEVTSGTIIPVTNIKVKSDLALYKGQSTTLKATVYPTNASIKTVTWQTSNPDVATVDDEGRITALKVGTATITATTDGLDKYHKQLSAKCNLTVNLIPVTGITLNKTSFTLFNNCSYKLYAKITPSNASIKTVKWKSFSPTIASIDSDGVVTAHRAGTVKIRALATDGSDVYADCMVKVIEPVTCITLSKTTLNMKTGKTYKLVATVLPENATYKKVTWASSDTSVAKVSTTGIITALKEGTCKITATSKDGSKITAECELNVTESVKVTLSRERLSLNTGKTFKIIATVTNADTKKVTWSSDNPNIASVTATGVVFGANPGQTYITATSVADPTAKAKCKVTIR